MAVQKWMLGLLLLSSCSSGSKFQRDKPAFEASKVEKHFTSIANMNDAHFEMRENNFFEFYRLLFDSVKNTSFPGKYVRSGDTLLLQFYSKKGKSHLGSRAVIDSVANHISFYK